MSKAFEELDFQNTVLGELILRRRMVPMLADEVVYEVILNDEFLMSSMFHDVEVALADLGLAALSGDRLDVVVGGLGLGYTAAAALEHSSVASLYIVEFLEPVIQWHQSGLVPLGQILSADPRTHFVEGDFFALCSDSRTGFDPAEPGRKFDAILLDIDHTPEHWLNDRHAAFYAPQGLIEARHHLRSGGVFAMWADGEADTQFRDRLAQVFSDVEAYTVTFPNPIRGDESCGAVYIGKA